MKDSKKETFSISIPNPCHENWNEMKAEEQGRFCLKCAKTVVDFTQKSKEQIKSYFEEVSIKVCGRFLNEQLTAEPIKVKVNQHKMRIFTCALYLVFGSLLFSCDTQKSNFKSKSLGQISCTFGELDPNRMVTDDEDVEIIKIIDELGAENERRVREEQNERKGFVVGFLAPIIIEEEVVFEEIKPTSVKESPIQDTNSQDPDQINGASKIKMR
jgi:hypothetical protein